MTLHQGKELQTLAGDGSLCIRMVLAGVRQQDAILTGYIELFIHICHRQIQSQIIVLGGIGIIPGAMIGGILVGLIEIFVKLFAPGWYEAVTYGTLIVILLVKPAGILGKNTGEKV